jgi:hypothetical protein
MAEKIKVAHGGYKKHHANSAEKKRAHEGAQKMCQALAEDEKEERQRGSGLPEDWQNKIIRAA